MSCREGCSAEEFESLVQRNMAANCGMDFSFMTEFMTSILQREMKEARYVYCPLIALSETRTKFSRAPVARTPRLIWVHAEG